MKPANNLVFNQIYRYQDEWNGVLTLEWYQGDDLVHRMEVTPQDLKEKVICPACLFWRAEIVDMTYRKGDHPQCPVCGGIHVQNQLCNCGEIPHRISCAMGIGLYFGEG